VAIEQNLYEGRKGQRRLKAIDRQIQIIKSEIQNDYEDTPEMIYLDEIVKWEGTGRLIFMMAFRKVHFMWNGLRDYGFIRLCKQWIEGSNLKTITSAEVVEMTRSILTEEMCYELSEELSALEIF